MEVFQEEMHEINAALQSIQGHGTGQQPRKWYVGFDTDAVEVVYAFEADSPDAAEEDFREVFRLVGPDYDPDTDKGVLIEGSAKEVIQKIREWRTDIRQDEYTEGKLEDRAKRVGLSMTAVDDSPGEYRLAGDGFVAVVDLENIDPYVSVFEATQHLNLQVLKNPQSLIALVREDGEIDFKGNIDKAMDYVRHRMEALEVALNARAEPVGLHVDNPDWDHWYLRNETGMDPYIANLDDLISHIEMHEKAHELGYGIEYLGMSDARLIDKTGETRTWGDKDKLVAYLATDEARMPKLPEPYTPEWKAYVADAVAKDPSQRTENEKGAIRVAMFNLDRDPYAPREKAGPGIGKPFGSGASIRDHFERKAGAQTTYSNDLKH